MKLSEALSKQARERNDLKLRSARMVAELMMAHFVGPFEDGQFYYEHDDKEMVEYFENAPHEGIDLYNDPEFRKLVIKMVANELGVTVRINR